MRLQTTRYLRFALVLSAFVAALGVLAAGQKDTGNAERFFSLDGLYSVVIPPEVSVGGGGSLDEGEFTEGFGGSYSTYWEGPGIYLQAAYIDFREDETTLPLAQRGPLLAKAVARLKRSESLVAGTQQKRVKLRRVDATDVVLKFAGSTTIYRLFTTPKGIVRLTAKISSDEAQPIADKFLDSLDAPTLSEMIAEKLREATPAPLPACDPKFAMVTDLTEMGLKGKVKSIYVEQISIDEGKTQREPQEYSTFDPQGRKVQEVSYEFARPQSVKAFGCIDGRRVSKSGFATYENQFTAMGETPADAQPPDERYTNAYETKLDDAGRVTEQLVYGNNAHVYSTVKFAYGSGTVTSTEYNDHGSVDKTELRTYDRAKRLTKSVKRHFDPEGTEWRNTYIYVQFDVSGNWIKRTGVYEMFENGKLDTSSKFTDLRTIKYY